LGEQAEENRPNNGFDLIASVLKESLGSLNGSQGFLSVALFNANVDDGHRENAHASA
jgi:hypothetical protein